MKTVRKKNVGFVKVGDTICISLDTIKNTCDHILEEIKVKVEFPEGFSIESTSFQKGNFDSVNNIWNVYSLAPNQFEHAEFCFKVEDDCNVRSNITFTVMEDCGCCEDCFSIPELCVELDGISCCDIKDCGEVPTVIAEDSEIEIDCQITNYYGNVTYTPCSAGQTVVKLESATDCEVIIGAGGEYSVTSLQPAGEVDCSFDYIVTCDKNVSASATVSLKSIVYEPQEIYPQDLIVYNQYSGLITLGYSGCETGAAYYKMINPPQHGVVTVELSPVYGERLIYELHSPYVGEDTFTYDVICGCEIMHRRIFNVVSKRITVDSDPDAFTTSVNVPVSGNVLINDEVCSEGDTTILIYTEPTNGSVILNQDGTFTYTPNLDFYGEDSFTYNLKCLNSLSSRSTVTITIEEACEDVDVSIDTVMGRVGSEIGTLTVSGDDYPNGPVPLYSIMDFTLDNGVTGYIECPDATFGFSERVYSVTGKPTISIAGNPWGGNSEWAGVTYSDPSTNINSSGEHPINIVFNGLSPSVGVGVVMADFDGSNEEARIITPPADSFDPSMDIPTTTLDGNGKIIEAHGNGLNQNFMLIWDSYSPISFDFYRNDSGRNAAFINFKLFNYCSQQ